MRRHISILAFGFVLVTFLAASIFPETGVIAQDSRGVLVPAPMSPHGTLLDSTPTYKWSVVSGANIYQYQVWRGSTKVLDKSPDAEDVCGATTCEKSPAYTLDYNLYKWRVRALKGGVWSAWSGYMEFNVSPAGFSSSFNNEMAGWTKKTGKDYFKSATYIYTPGLTDKWSSIYRPNAQYTDFIYTVRMKKSAGTSSNYILVRMGTKVEATEGVWYPGYYFGYDNSGRASIYKIDPVMNANMIHSATTSLINKYGWNTIKVKAIGWKFWFYVNGCLVKYFTDTDFPRGYIGITSFRDGTDQQSFYVDNASLVVQVTPQ
jgi:hypothetical protein